MCQFALLTVYIGTELLSVFDNSVVDAEFHDPITVVQRYACYANYPHIVLPQGGCI
jgi:hypothetical protein